MVAAAHASGWFHTEPPPEWLWIGLGLAILGVVLAVGVPALFAWLARPIVRVEFNTYSGDEGRQLYCYIKHPHIERGWIRALGIIRQPIAQAVTSYWVNNDETDKEVIPKTIVPPQPLIGGTPQNPLNTKWEPNDLGEVITIAEWDSKNGNQIIYAKARGILPPARYRCTVEIQGSVYLKKTRRFVAASGELRWLD